MLSSKRMFCRSSQHSYDRKKNAKVEIDYLASCAIKDRCVDFYTDVKGTHVAERETFGHYLSDIHRFAKTLVAHSDPLFEFQSNFGIGNVVSTRDGDALLSIFRSYSEIILDEYVIHKFSPVATIFLEEAKNFNHTAVDNLNIPIDAKEAQALYDYLDQLVARIRYLFSSKETIKATSDFRRSATKNFNRCIESLAAVVDGAEFITILRFDIHYKSQERSGLPKTRKQILQELFEIRALRTAFHRKMRATLASQIGGWMCCLEYGRYRGWHYHYLVVLKGAQKNSDRLIDNLGADWEVLTGIPDSYDNVNKRSHYRFNSTGILSLGYAKSVVGLQFIAAYFTLGDCFVQLDLPSEDLTALNVTGIRSFIMGDFPEVMPRHRNKGKGPLPGLKIRVSHALKRVRFL